MTGISVLDALTAAPSLASLAVLLLLRGEVSRLAGQMEGHSRRADGLADRVEALSSQLMILRDRVAELGFRTDALGEVRR